MEIVSWNINSIKIRLKILIDLIKKYNVDYIALQETKVKDENFPEDELRKFGFYSFYSGEGGRNGVCILSKEKEGLVKIGFLDGEEDIEKRLISVKFKDFYIVNVYIPLGGTRDSNRFHYKLKFYDRLKRYFIRFHKKDEKIFLCGDFNVAFSELDVYDPNEVRDEVGFLIEEREKLKDLISFGFYDAFRLLYPDLKTFTWWDYRWKSYEKNKGMRLDYIFITEPLIKDVEDVIFLKEYRELDKPSDHIPILIKIKR